MKVTGYRCEFWFHGINHYVRAGSLADLKDGFWIDADLHFTKGSGAAFWIPPSQIIYVQKETRKS